MTPTADSPTPHQHAPCVTALNFIAGLRRVEMGERLGQEALALGQRLADPAQDRYITAWRGQPICAVRDGAMCERAEAGYQQANNR
ncbi:MAG: hypothetical protein R3E79_51990 [Caldilineaceae bacterium]